MEERLMARLESAAARLEARSLRGGSVAGSGGDDASATDPSIVAFEDFMGAYFGRVSSAGEKIGGQVLEVTKILEQALEVTKILEQALEVTKILEQALNMQKELLIKIKQTQMERFLPSSMDDLTEFDPESLLLSPASEVPVNQGSILCNDQGGHNNVINDSIQQTTQFPTSFPETMPQTGHGYMTPNATTSQHGEFNQSGPSSPSPWYQPNPNLFDPQCANPVRDQQLTNYQLPMSNQVPGPQPPMNQWLPPEVPDNQSSLSSRINQNEPNWPQPPSRYLPHPNLSDPRCANPMLPGPSMPLRHQYSNTHQPQPGHGYMTPNATTSEHGGFIQPGPPFTAPRSQMDNLQVRGLQNQTARPNASNTGLGTSLQSQNRGLNTQQVEMVRSKDPFWNYIDYTTDGSMKCKFCPHTFANKTSISRIKWHLAGEERRGVAICRGVAKEVQEAAFLALCGGNKRQKITATAVNVNDCGITTIVGVTARGRAEMEDQLPTRSSESLKNNKTRGVPLPTSSINVGQAFEENKKVICSLLMDDEVPTIGIYGMGGVCKTTILQHIHNELLQRPDICDHVWWVTLSQDFSINRLQNLIAKHLHRDLSSEDDVQLRPAKLSEELRKKQKWILILDDLWNNFELHEVGIPVSLKGCKLILTTRSETVCHGIACNHKIQVKRLFEGEAWTLLKENLGHDMTVSEVEGIAKAIARECAGLLLGIITVARSLRGVDDLHQWRNTLNKLKEIEFRDTEVFKLLRFSYDRLGDLALQQCLLYCALFLEDDMIEREELIGYLIDEGIIKGKRSRGDTFGEGHTMLNRLENVCLLEGATSMEDDSRCVKMHDLIRDMVIQILLENSTGMVKAGAQLKKLPDAEEWTENLTRVSLMQNEIVEISSSHSPMCPNLSTLFLKEVGSLRNLETLECHFKRLFDFMEYLRSRDGIQSLSAYKFFVGMVDKDFWGDFNDFPSKTVGLGSLIINKDRDFQVKFLNGIQGLVCGCIDARSLCDVLSLENATELEEINIWDCNSMESRVSSSWFCSAPPPLPSYNGGTAGGVHQPQGNASRASTTSPSHSRQE